MHIANSGRVIVRLSREVKEGQIICDKDNQKIGRITELIGPVKNPFASAIPLTNNVKKISGTKVLENQTNNDYQRRGVITKGAILETEDGKCKVISRPGQCGIINAVLVKW